MIVSSVERRKIVLEKSSYEILSGDTVTAVWENDTLTVRNAALLPLYLRRIPHGDLWLETRAIDSHRANSRLLKKALRLAERDDLSTVRHVYGATITDNYWIRPIGSAMTYKDVAFSNDYFATLALKGSYDSFQRAATGGHSHTPELTNLGSFEKCWRLRDGKWWLTKRANHEELFSELFVCTLGVALGMSMAHYERGDGCIRSLDFTHTPKVVNFEPAATFMGDNDDYTDVVSALEKLCPSAIPDYIAMLFLDTICANPERHTQNFGLLRDPATGELLGAAPNFDNNMALIARGYPTKVSKNDILITLFADLLDEYPQYKNILPTVTEELLQKIIEQIGMRVRKKAVVDLVYQRYTMLIEHL